MQRIKWILVGALCIYPVMLMVMPFIDTLIFSIFAYYSIRPLFKKVDGVIKHKTASIIVSIMLIIVPLVLFLMYLANVASTELISLSRNLGPGYKSIIADWVGQYAGLLSNMNWGEVLSLAKNNADLKGILDLGLGLISGIFDKILRTVLVFAFTYLFLAEGTRFHKWFVREVIHQDKRQVVNFMDSVDRDLESVFYGNILTAIIVTANGVIVFTLINVFFSTSMVIPYPVLMGVMCGIASLIPGVGVSLIWVPATILLGANAYLTDGLGEHIKFIGIFAAASLILVDFIPSWLLRAKISGKGVDDTLLFLAYILGPLTFGISGILIGPIVLVLTVNFAKLVVPKLRII